MAKGPETEKSHNRRINTGFYRAYMHGAGLDIGYKGSIVDAEPVLDSAIGVDIDYPGYDGLNLPFLTDSVDYVYNSHVLEHVNQPIQALQEWFRVLKEGGYLIICVPHKLLYEKKQAPPSRYNGDHKIFFTPANLLALVEQALPENGFRVRHLEDNDNGYDYSIPPERHAGGCYEIVLVVQKIKQPNWKVL